MTTQNIKINSIPAVIYSDEKQDNNSGRLYLYIHGKMGFKEEAESFAETVCPKGYRVLSIDLPDHGERKSESGFVPWKIVPELKSVLEFAHEHCDSISLRAASIGAWFSLLAFADERFEKCLFLSPVTDMELLIKNMMTYANVTEEMLEQQKKIPTDMGETLDIEYYRYAQSHPITKWRSPTAILYGSNDILISREAVTDFARRFDCTLTTAENCEHWFHTKEQLDVLRAWEEKNS